MLAFLERTQLEGIGVVQRSKYISAFRLLFKALNKDFDEFTAKDLEVFLLSMAHLKPKTRKTRWYDVKKFFKYLGREDLFKGVVSPTCPRLLKLPEQLLTEEEVNSMVAKAGNLRDKAFISTMYESGCRIGELLPATRTNVVFDKYGGVLTVDGKTGMRRLRLVRSVPLLANWMANHPQNSSIDFYLWTGSRSSGMPIQYRTAVKILENTAKLAGITKKVHPHLLRHSRATHLANKLTEQQLKVYFGWSGDSKMVATYVHLSGRDIDDAILQLNGVRKIEARKEEPQVKKCVRCESDNDFNALYCSKCGMVLSEKEACNIAVSVVPNPDKSDKDFQQFLMELYNQWKIRRCDQ